MLFDVFLIIILDPHCDRLLKNKNKIQHILTNISFKFITNHRLTIYLNTYFCALVIKAKQ